MPEDEPIIPESPQMPPENEQNIPSPITEENEPEEMNIIILEPPILVPGTGDYGFEFNLLKFFIKGER